MVDLDRKPTSEYVWRRNSTPAQVRSNYKEKEMKYVKMLGLFALAATALMAFAGSASATQVTCKNAAGIALEICTPELHAVSEGEVSLENAAIGLKVQCKSTVAGKVESHGTTATAIGKIAILIFKECTNGYTVTVLKNGSLELHTEGANANGNGTLTSTGAEVTVDTPLGFSCTYTTNATDLGVLTGSINTAGTATLDIPGANIPRTGDSGMCGIAAILKGSYEIDTVAVGGVDRADYLDVD